MRINTNISALTANAYLSKSESNLTRALERLSSGYKINRAVDDAAGKAISEKMKRQIRGLDRSSMNAQDGISVVETAEGALGEITGIIQRMRELAVQGADDTYSDDDRGGIQSEIEQLQKEIDRIARDTEFNNKTLLDGNLQRRTYTDTEGAEISNLSNTVAAGKYEVTVDALPQKAQTTMTGALAAGTAGKMKVNGAQVEILATDTLDEVIEKVRDAADRAGIVYENGTFTSQYYGSSQRIDVTFSQSLKDAWGTTNIENVQGTDTQVTLTTTSADEEITNFKTTATISSDGEKFTITDRGEFSLEFTIDPDVVKAGDVVVGEVTDMGTMVIQLGTNTGQTMNIIIPEVTNASMGLEKLNYRTDQGCDYAITALDEALAYVSRARTQIGAQENRLEKAVSSLDVTNENMTSAVSRLADVDMAKEMTSYTSYNVLQQAGTTMLAQANQLPERVLQLLQ